MIQIVIECSHVDESDQAEALRRELENVLPGHKILVDSPV